MNVLLFGATGMVGQGVLLECIRANDVDRVLCVGRTPVEVASPKLVNLVVQDLFGLTACEATLSGYDACFFCLGVSSSGMSEAQYRRLTYDLTVSVASTLARLNASMTFIYVSGVGTDSTETSRTMWARVKGATENAILKMHFKAAFMFRPGIIIPLDGLKSKTTSYRFFYDLLGPLMHLLYQFRAGSMTTTRSLGKAMIQLVRRGSEEQVLEGAAINRIAQEGERQG